MWRRNWDCVRRFFARNKFSKLIAGPQRPVVEIATRAGLLEKRTRKKDAVVGLKPQMALGLPSELRTGSVSNVSCATTVCSCNKEARHGVHTILNAFPPLKNPVNGNGEVMWKQGFEVRMQVDKVDRTGTRCGQHAKVVSLGV